ncbi:MAG: signal transduction histidine kinase [Ilumatobacteraceae bacterium]|nr:signal transduction histidine kinase [Ilumatobacteraceae bacterium]
MSLRLKIVLALMLLAATATTAIGAWSYISTRTELGNAVDRSLDTASQRHDLLQLAQESVARAAGRPRSFDAILVQAIDSSGQPVMGPNLQQVLPVTQVDIDVALSDAPDPSTRHDVRIDGEPFRVLTVPSLAGGAIQLARSLQENENSLNAILRHTLWAIVIAVAASIVVGWLLGRQLTRRLVRLTAAVSAVATTGRLDVDVPRNGADETARLGAAFSGMLGALARSRQEQTQLVQDAGHELRTPLTSLRTNVSVLRDYERLEPDERQRLIADLDSESRELTALVNELVELATDRHDEEPAQHLLLGEVASRAVARTTRRTGREIVLEADNSAIVGQPAALERAVQNLVDNAAKFAMHGTIEVSVHERTVAVRDHGDGIRADDLPHVFDRFFRAVEQRSKPGSGLGLAIVKSVVDAHHGSVFATNATDGGAIIGFTLPAG